MKLTRLQRHTTYIIMLAEIENPSLISYNGDRRWTTENGLCWLYKMIFDFDFDYNFRTILPELSKYEEKNWWSDYPIDWDIRRMALNQCIEETF